MGKESSKQGDSAEPNIPDQPCPLTGENSGMSPEEIRL
jgi:hypothetical protein